MADFSSSSNKNISSGFFKNGSGSENKNQNQSSELYSQEGRSISNINENINSIRKMESKDINQSLLLQEYSNNSNQSRNLNYMSINQSRHSSAAPNKELFLPFKDNCPEQAQKLEEQIEKYIQTNNAVNKFINNNKKKIIYPKLSDEKKLIFFSKIKPLVEGSRNILSKDFIYAILSILINNWLESTQEIQLKEILLKEPYCSIIDLTNKQTIHLIEDCFVNKMKEKFKPK